jgi:hypothetical protein
MPLKGEAKRLYMREYMRRKRLAQKKTSKLELPKSPDVNPPEQQAAIVPPGVKMFDRERDDVILKSLRGTL